MGGFGEKGGGDVHNGEVEGKGMKKECPSLSFNGYLDTLTRVIFRRQDLPALSFQGRRYQPNRIYFSRGRGYFQEGVATINLESNSLI